MEAPAAYAAGVLDAIKVQYGIFKRFGITDPQDPTLAFLFGDTIRPIFGRGYKVSEMVGYVMFTIFKLFKSPFDNSSWSIEMVEVLNGDYSNVTVPYYDDVTVLAPIRKAVSNFNKTIDLSEGYIQSMDEAGKLGLVHNAHIMSIHITGSSMFTNYGDFERDIVKRLGLEHVFVIRPDLITFMNRYKLRFHSRMIEECFTRETSKFFYLHENPRIIANGISKEQKVKLHQYPGGYSAGSVVILSEDKMDKYVIISHKANIVRYYEKR